MKNQDLRPIVDAIRYQLDRAEKLHPEFAESPDLVLDCFSGSGTTAVACHNMHRRFICIEKDPEYYAASVKRLEEAQRQLLFNFNP